MSLNSFSFTAPTDITSAIEPEKKNWDEKGLVERIWNKDASVWTNNDESKWLGWLNIIDQELDALSGYTDLQEDISSSDFKDIVLMGMGGSSLCPEVLAKTFGKRTFHILDSTVPAQVKALEECLQLDSTLFIVASKSGSTLEPNCFKQYFFDRVSALVGREKAGRQFIAITDPGSKMEQIAREDGFRQIFYGKPDIGGRFSALSAFGMTAASVMGLKVKAFLESSRSMQEACRAVDAASNPGASLGIILGICQRLGRDKLTIFTSPEIHDLGAWLEQLVAESTGKNGVAIIPVDREPALEPDKYGQDRIFAFLSVNASSDWPKKADALAEAGHPVVKVSLDTIDTLGQEFFRWEFATAVAGSIMKINPFNQPDVESAKIEARKLTDEFESKGSFPDEHPFFQNDGFSFYAGKEYGDLLLKCADEPTAKGVLKAHIAQVQSGDYFALLAYVEMTDSTENLLTNIRRKVLQGTHAATCLGFGPRFLHSTGQAYKGGGNNGVFLQITSDDNFDIEIPGQKYTFGVVKTAQARGDFQVLVDRGRRALRVHIGPDVENGLRLIGSRL